MKLFPTNLFSAGQHQSDSSQRKLKDNQAFASLVQEDSPDWSRQVSNNTRMDRAEEAHDSTDRPDQQASGPRKAENRGSKHSEKTREEPAQKAEASSSDKEQIDASKQTAAVSDSTNMAQDSSEEPNALDGTTLQQGVTDSEASETAALAGLSVDDIIPMPILQAAVQAPIDGKPIGENNPLVGATLLSPAALGGIEGLNQTSTDGLIAVDFNPTSDTAGSPILNALMPEATGPQVQMTPINAALEQGLTAEALAMKASTGLQPTVTEQSAQINADPALLSSGVSQATQPVLSTPQQSAQSMLGGSLFQEMVQKGEAIPGFKMDSAKGPELFAKNPEKGLSLEELPAEFQEAKSVWTQVDPRKSTIQQNTDTLSQLHSEPETSEPEVEGELAATTKSTRPVQIQNRPGMSNLQSPTTPTNNAFAAEIAQDQSIEQRVEVRNETQNVMLQNAAPTPEGHVPALAEVMVEVDEDLRVGVKTTGREVAVSIDGSTRAVEEMRHIGPELQESLENLGFTLSEFSTNEEAETEANESEPSTSLKESDKSHSERSQAAPTRSIRRGAQIDTTA